MDKLFVPHELKTIEVDTEKKVFKINGEDFGKSCTGFTISCYSYEDFDIRCEIDAMVRFVSIRGGECVEDRSYQSKRPVYSKPTKDGGKDRMEKKELKPVDATSIHVDDYSEIIVFRSEEMFKGVLSVNPHLKAIHGEREIDKQLFPGLYVAGIKAASNEQHQADAETELLQTLTPEELQGLGEGIAEIIRQYNLQRRPDVCRKLFGYLSDVIDSWNAV